MSKVYSVLCFLIVASVIAGCSPAEIVRAEEVRASPATAEWREIPPTKVPEKLVPTDTANIATLPIDPPLNCPLTLPQDPAFVPPGPYAELGFGGSFWYGSDLLWTSLPENGAWANLPHNPEGLTQKTFWWSEQFFWRDELEPALLVTGERLDAKAPSFTYSDATNASATDIGSAMLMGINIPTPGCWKITGMYKKTDLSFVVWVAP